MLSENIKAFRKQKGYSQETLAEQLNVVRQTISKWEKGYSVPDADMLEKMAGIFEIRVDELLGSEPTEPNRSSDMESIVNQLAILNEQLALQQRRRRRTWMIVLITAGVLLFSSLLLNFAARVSYDDTPAAVAKLECTLDGETYIYQITYDKQYRVLTAGGSAWIADHVQTEKYNDANVLIAQIEDYFKLRGGTCVLTETRF